MKKQNQRKNKIAQRNLGMEPLEPRCLLAGLQGITVDDGSLLQSIETVAPREMTLVFDANESISDSASSMAGITLVHGGADRTLDTADDIVVQPGFIGIGDRPNEVVLRFAENLPDNIYRLEISGNGSNAVRNIAGEAFDQDANQAGIQDFSRIFRLDLGAQVVSVVPQPIDRSASGAITQRLNQIDVYFNNDPLDQASAERRDFYQLRFTGHSSDFSSSVDTAHDLDDVVHLPQSVSYDAAANKAVLTFASNLDQLDNGGTDGTGTYRLQVGLDSTTPLRNIPESVDGSADQGDEFSTALDLGEVFARGTLVDAAIDTRVDPLPYPGAIDEVGHRDIPNQNHFVFGDFASDLNPGATTILYNFKDVYGQDPSGNDLQNLITENQKNLSRQILDLFSYYAGLQFVETEDLGFTIATGDLRAVAIDSPTGPGGVIGIATPGNFLDGLAIMDATEQWTDEYASERGNPDGISWFSTAMHEIGHVLGLGHTHELPANTIMGQDETGGLIGLGTQTTVNPEVAFPGSHDIAHLRHIHRPESNDVDLYKFNVSMPGEVTIETFAERLENASLADTHITVWHEVNGDRVRIAANDDYYSEDSFLKLSVEAGTYYVGVASTGNDNYNPNVANSGAGGTSEGKYQLRVQHRAELGASQQIQDSIQSLHPDPIFTPASSQPLDGDYDGVAGGAFNFWFRVASPANTHIVDKTGNGDFTEIDQAMNAAQIGDIVRVVGNGGADGDFSTIADNSPYLIGKSILGDTLADGSAINVKRGVTLMVDAGAILKFRGSSIIAGSTAPGINRSGAAVQILGTPDDQVYLGSYRDDALGGDSDGFPEAERPGDWGGILFAGNIDAENDQFDYEHQSIFLNYVNNANISNAGGQISVDSVSQTAAPIEMVDVRATATFNTIINSAEAAIAASPDSFEETNFHAPENQTTRFAADYTRVGPVVHGNTLSENSINGLFIRTETVPGEELTPMTVSGRWDDIDIPHVVTENLTVLGDAGVLLDESNVLSSPQSGTFIARPDASLIIDPGTVVKLDGALIEVGNGAQFIAEGLDGKPVILTSLFDDEFGGSGTFDTTSDGTGATGGAPGDWGGIYLNFTANGSIDRARIAYGGGIVPVEGSFGGFNVIEVHQAKLRLTNSIVENSAGGTGGQAPLTRFGRTENAPGAIFIRNSQPILINNVIQNTNALVGEELASAINVNVNSLNRDRVVDYGRATGLADAFQNHVGNQGPLVVGNRIGGNDLNGMEVRGGTLTTEVVLDDTDMVHLVFEEISVPNFHTSGGLRLESSPLQSLVVKLSNSVRGGESPFIGDPNDPLFFPIFVGCSGDFVLIDADNDGFAETCGTAAGFTAAGRPLDIDDRIGGSVQIVGHPNFPVVLTSISDNTVGAGQTPDGRPQLEVTDESTRIPSPGDWRSVRFEEFSNDRNVDTVIEFEPSDIDFANTAIARNNARTSNAQFIGQLAGNERSGDENQRLGFDVHGTVSRNNDVDTYSFAAKGGTEVWFDIDHTTNSLDAILELVNADGEVIATSNSSHLESNPVNNDDPTLPNVNARNLSKSTYYETDQFSINPRDPGMRLILQGVGTNTYHIRVRSDGASAGAYELQVRLREVDEIAGSTVRFADIRYATNGVELIGVPGHSPLLGETSEIPQENGVFGSSQAVGNLFNSDRGAITIAGLLSTSDDVDWYNFDVGAELTQRINDPNDPDPADPRFENITIDLDYADGASRPNASFALYNSDGYLVAFADDSNIADDQNAPNGGAGTTDLERGSVGFGDAYLGPLSLPEGNYSLAVFSDSNIPRELAATLDRGILEEFDGEINRFIPIDSASRIAIDHADGIPIADASLLNLQPVPLTVNDLKLFITTDDDRPDSTVLNTVNAFTGQHEYAIGRFPKETGDLAVRPQDGALISLTYGEVNDQSDDATGDAILISAETAEITGLDGGMQLTDDGIETNGFDDMGEFGDLDVGINFEGLTFGGGRFWGVGNPGAPTGNTYEENILYMFDQHSLEAIPNQEGALRTEDALMEGAGTNIVDRGFIDTNSIAGDQQLTVQGDATGTRTVGGEIVTDFFIKDGQQFATSTGDTYELNSGAQILLSAGQVRDGDILSLDTGAIVTEIQFDTGPVLVIDNIAGVVAGATITIGGVTFEYVLGPGNPASGNSPINIAGAASPFDLADVVARTIASNTILQVDNTLVQVNGTDTFRLTFRNDVGAAGTTVASTGVLGGTFQGEYGGNDASGALCTPGTTCIVVSVEETSTVAEIGAAIVTAYGNAMGSNNRVGFARDRMNFLDADSATFDERTNNANLDFIEVVAGNSQTSGGAISVEFLAEDSADDIADRIGAIVPGTTVVDDTVILSNGWSVPGTDNPPFTLTGSNAAGGIVTGIAWYQSDPDDADTAALYAVTDTGGLFRVDEPDTPADPMGTGAAMTTFIADLGLVDDVNTDGLTGLTLAPAGFDDGALDGVFIAVDNAGDIHAFDFNGVPVELFASGSSAATGLGGAKGIGVSNYEVNAWHLVDTAENRDGFQEYDRFGDRGHGTVTPITAIAECEAALFPSCYIQGDGPLELDYRETAGDNPAYYFGREARLEHRGDRFEEVGAYEYNFSGGARGSLESDPFSLANVDSADQPFLYFSYIADTENQNGRDGMADSFRVYLEDDFGTYHLLATNNGFRVDTGVDPDEYDVDLDNNRQRTTQVEYGRVQEIFDDEGDDRPTVWRQARVPLAEFANQSELRLRFDFATEGGRNDASLPADGFGDYDANINQRAVGVEDNNHEGVWIDDIIIGLAERGELITNLDRADTNQARIVDNPAVPDDQINVGAYQIEIRRGRTYTTPAVIDSNDRLTEAVWIQPDEGDEIAPAGNSFELSNGLEEFVFEFVEEGQTPTIADAITIGFQPGATQLQVATALVDTINTVGPGIGLGITAELTRGVTGTVNLHGDTVILLDDSGLLDSEIFDDVGDNNRIREQGQIVISSNYIRDSSDFGIRIEAGDRSVDGSPRPGSPISFIETNQSGLVPGAAIINNLLIRGAQGGILIDGDSLAEQTGSAARAATPFARVINNTIVGSSSGTNGVGVQVTNSASPTLLNNILDSLVTGISVDGFSQSTVVGGSLFRNVDSPGVTGDFAIELATFETLFVNPLGDNFFPSDSSKAIDSSVDSLNDRDELVTVRDPLGIEPSPILAPTRDASGQLRVDDPDVDSSAGQGSQVFIDRGALDRSDFLGPNALMISPRDNDPDGLDLNDENHDLTLLENAGNPIRDFTIQLVDGGGSDNSLGGFGVDDATVLSDSVMLYRDEELLTDGEEYIFEYDSTNNQIRLVPATGVWASGIYRVELSESIQDLFGNPLLANRAGGSTIFNLNIGGGTSDFGDAPSPYRTLLSVDGARHSLADGSDLYLGMAPSTESDGRAMDTDDGIIFSTDLIQGSTASILATASQAGMLDAWIDFDGNGVWDAGEQIATSLQLVAGENTVTFTVPESAMVASTYGRFRLSSAGNLGPLGETIGGEVEDHAVTIQSPGDDYGDAPDVYNTTLAQDGPVHTIDPGFFLGSSVDGDPDGIGSSNADADTGDDGVSFGTGFLVGRTTDIVVTASEPGILNAWIDWNGDRTWSADEQLTVGGNTDISLTAGANTISVLVPTNAVENQSYGRFRFSSAGGLSTTGPATDGEVEDHLTSISRQTWHNNDNRLDVDNDGVIAPLDAIQVINELNSPSLSNGPGELPVVASSPPFLDVNNDGFLSPIDALLIINQLNADAAASNTAALSASVSLPTVRDVAFESVDDVLEEDEDEEDAGPWWLS